MPVWEAQYIIVLTERTGWTEDFIRWRLPLWRGMAYYHACRLLAGERCRWPQRKAQHGAWAQQLKTQIREQVARMNLDKEGEV